MNFLFFDIEAANRHNKTAKIYSIGYVLSDNQLNIIEEREIVINPEADYYFQVDGVDTKIDCPIDESIMQNANIFSFYYEEIRRLVSLNICFGYHTSIDAHMLNESCKRYNKELFDFYFYDLKDIAEVLLSEKISGLSKLAQHLNISNNNPHNGLSDAKTTYEIFKELMKKNKDVIESLESTPNIYMYRNKNNKVFRIVNGKYEYVPKRIFKDMKIKEDLDNMNTFQQTSTDSSYKNNAMKLELEKWLKKSD